MLLFFIISLLQAFIQLNWSKTTFMTGTSSFTSNFCISHRGDHDDDKLQIISNLLFRVDVDSPLHTDLLTYRKEYGVDHILLNCTFKVVIRLLLQLLQIKC